jgi:CelD/BcsL family acetyltransferase involved in cellulose biosynthesis
MSAGPPVSSPPDGRPAAATSAADPIPRVRLDVVSSPEGLGDLRPEWEDLEREVDGATVYQTWAWVTSWYEHFGAGKRLELAAARDRAGRLVGVVPLSRGAAAGPGPRLLHFLGRGNDLTEYVDALLSAEHAAEVVQAVFRCWDARRGAWDLWRLPAAPVESPLVQGLRAAAAARGYAVVAEEHHRVTLALPSTWADFHAGLGKNMKKHLRKFANRLERDGKPELVVVADPGAADAALDVLFELHQRRAGMELGRIHDDRLGGADEQAFLRTVTRRLAERDRVRLFLLEIDGQTAAAQLCFSLGRRLFASYSGYDPRWAWHAAMMFLFRRCLEHAIAEGYCELDLGLGHDQEKLRWGGQPRLVVNLTLASPRLRSRAMLRLWQWRRRRQAGAAVGGQAEVSGPAGESEEA